MAKKISFEERLERLEHIVEALDSGEETLESMIALYEEGMKNITEARQQLLTAEQRITKIQRDSKALNDTAGAKNGAE